MNPCSKNHKLIAWLTLDALDVHQARKLRAHLETCERCRRYLKEISGVTAKLTAAEASSEILASESFHRDVVTRLRAEASTSVWETVAAYPRAILANWRVALAAATVLVVAAIATLVATLRHPGISSPAPSGGQIVSAPRAVSDLPPTIAQYRMVANRSLDTLDELLTRQGSRALPPTPIYTASTRAAAGESD